MSPVDAEVMKGPPLRMLGHQARGGLQEISELRRGDFSRRHRKLSVVDLPQYC